MTNTTPPRRIPAGYAETVYEQELVERHNAALDARSAVDLLRAHGYVAEADLLAAAMAQNS